ncbi:MAG: UDP-2,3-diacylglucosamine diphosphatase [Planctomycetota bacterium]
MYTDNRMSLAETPSPYRGHRTTGDGADRGVVRSLFVSDVHLGCKHAQAAEFLEMLERFEPRNLYIVGDFIDGWKLKRRWRWLPVYDRVLQRMMALKRSGTRLMYTPGNHDSFLRGFLANFGVIEIHDRFIHEAADGRRFVVTHGDQFDRIEQNCQWLSLVASYAYDVLLTANWWGNKLRGKKHDPYAFCGAIKRRVKRLVKHVSEFEQQLLDDARGADCDGIICGHVHAPRITSIDEVAYLNTGDWVENCTALVEFEDGSFDLIRRDGEVVDRLAAREQVAEPPLVAAIA